MCYSLFVQNVQYLRTGFIEYTKQINLNQIWEKKQVHPMRN